MKKYSVARLSGLAGISVRTLHLYDQLGLLKPGHRTDAGYRLYGEPELLKLQQILFYKEMGISLEAIGHILNDPDFDLLQALEGHRQSMLQRKAQTETMLDTINKTIINLKEKNMLQHDELYEGLSKEQAEQYRKEAVEKYGEHAIERAEYSLRTRTGAALELLKKEQQEITALLFSLKERPVESDEVQSAIALHYQNIRKFWGTYGDADPQKDAYMGLAVLYLNDERFLQTHGSPQPQFAQFMKEAMHCFAARNLS